MPVRIKYDIVPEFVKPKLDDLNVTTVTLQEYVLKPSQTISAVIDPPINNKDDSSGDSWRSWTISLSLDGLKVIADVTEKVLEKIKTISDIVVQILKIIRLFNSGLISLSFFLKFAIKMLVTQLKEFIDSLASTGLYSSLIIPNFNKTFPKYSIPTFGGYQEFISRVNATCLTSTDPDAPKFEEADKVGGVIIAMLGGVSDPDFLRNLLDNFEKISKLFGFKAPFPSPAKNFKAVPGFYEKNDVMTLGVKLTWECPESPTETFFVYRKNKQGSIPTKYTISGKEVTVNLFTNSDPILKQKYNPLRPQYSYIDFDIEPETTYMYKIYSVFGDDYLDEHPEFKDISSPIATPQVTANVPAECIPVSELKKYTNLSISGEFLSPFDFEGDWQSVTVRRMLGSQIDSVYDRLDALADKLIGMVNTGSDAISGYLDFYGERLEDLIEVVEKIKDIILWLSQFTVRGTFMVLSLPLEKGGMRGFVDRFNTACSSGDSSKETPKDKKNLKDAVNSIVKIEKNSPISTFNEKGIMFGLILLYGIPDIGDPERLKELVPEDELGGLKVKYKNTEKAISALLKMLGLG